MQYAVRESARLSAQKWRTPRRGSSAFSTMRSVGSPHAAMGIARYGWFLYTVYRLPSPASRQTISPARSRGFGAAACFGAEGRRGLCRSRLRSLLRRLPALRPALRRRGIPPGFGGELDLRRKRRERGARQPPVQRQHTVLRRHHAEIAPFPPPYTLRRTSVPGSSHFASNRVVSPSRETVSVPFFSPVYQNRICFTHFITPSIFYAPSGSRRVCSRREQIKSVPFSTATCASEKIPLGSQTCERSEMRCSGSDAFKRTPQRVGFV